MSPPPATVPPRGFIAAFAGHRIAPNLLMVMMICSGFFVAGRFETRFFPEFSTQTVIVSAAWRGASAEDVAESLLTPMENELRNIPDLKRMRSTATNGGGVVSLEFIDGVDEDDAADDVRRYLDLAAPNLPSDSDAPEVQVAEYPDEIMRLSLSGGRLEELRALARRLETELLQLNAVRVAVSGLPKDVIEIRLNRRRLAELDLSPAKIGAQISAQNIDVTAGDIESGGNRLLRSLSKRRTVADLAELPILDNSGEFVRLGDIAELVRLPDSGEPTVFFNGRPAVQFDITRTSNGDTLDDAKTVLRWLEQKRAELPQGVEMDAHKQEWQIVDSRLSLLLDNGLQGLALVLLLLFLLLNWRLAAWVAAGIPAVFMVALCLLFLLGGSLDVLTMFAFIMTTGIVVDDAIVVGENALHHRQMGKSPLVAAVDGAREMFPAVLASTFTTIASFMPLLIIGGPIGSILFVIPLVVISVLFAALFECFTVLPGHLKSVFRHVPPDAGGRKGGRIDAAFKRFEEGVFRRMVALALRYRLVVLTAAVVLLVLSVSLFIGGLVKYRFFAGGELNRIYVQAEFVAGTPKRRVEDFMRQLTDGLHDAAATFPEGGGLVRYVSLYMGAGIALDPAAGGAADGDEVASMIVELPEADERTTRVAALIAAWRERVPQVSGLDSLSILEESAGPPGEDLQVRLTGNDIGALKAAAQALRAALPDVPGVSRPKDDLPYGKEQIIFELTSLGRVLNLSVNDIAAQLNAAFDGYKVQTLYEGVDEVEVRTLLAGDGALEDFSAFRVALPNGGWALLTDVVRLSSRRSFDQLRRVDGESVVHVIGEVDFAVTDSNTALSQVENDLLPDIAQQYGVSYSFAGAHTDEQQTVEDMKTGLLIAFFSIFIILAAVFSSWTLPLVIILTAPLGIIGAILGHWLLGYEMSILSMFGIFTLNGIVVNDSIILVRDYLARVAAGAADGNAAIVDSVCRRLRAILLTSLTTIGGLTPLMFETSTQAQFLIPMAISICFGLGFSTLLILFVMPVVLSLHNSIGGFKNRLLARPSAPSAGAR